MRGQVNTSIQIPHFTATPGLISPSPRRPPQAPPIHSMTRHKSREGKETGSDDGVLDGEVGSDVADRATWEIPDTDQLVQSCRVGLPGAADRVLVRLASLSEV